MEGSEESGEEKPKTDQGKVVGKGEVGGAGKGEEGHCEKEKDD